MPVVLNAANEIAVEAFLRGRVSFGEIARIVERAMNRHHSSAPGKIPADLAEIVDLDRCTRVHALSGM